MATGQLTEAIFAANVNTNFVVDLGEWRVTLQLIRVRHYRRDEHEGMERFSLYFKGPSEPLLQQQIYAMDHDTLGRVEIFIVPVASDESGITYEAVFNFQVSD